MLRDPSAFLWRYALGWHSVDEEDRPLGLDQGSFGELVHELLKRAVDILNPNPGYARADLEHIEAAITQAAEFVRTAWPPHRRVPPALLWAHTLTSASRMALRALTGEPKLQADSKSWTEVSFGLPQKPKEGTADVPWDPTIPVPIPGTAFHVRGTIDRVDIRADGAVRVSDYKTGIEPEDIRGAVMKGGAELQRVIYAIAARQLVPTTPGVISRLLYLSSSTPQEYRLANMAEAISDIASYVSTAADAVKKGLALPGPAASEDFNEYAIALPAMRRIYLQRKRSSIHDAFGVLVEVWRCR